LTLGFFCFQGCFAPPWKEVSFVDEGFECLMPAHPQPFDKEYPSAYGKLKVRFKVLTYKYATFTMSVTDFPLEYVKSSTVDAILVSARDSAMNEVDGTLMDEKAVVAGNLPGREIRYYFGEGKARRIARARIYIGGSHLFQLHATVLESGTFNDDVDRFLNTVKIKKEYKGIASESAQWSEMVSKDGKFKVLTVGTPFLKDEAKDGLNQPCYFFNSGGSAYAISWIDINKIKSGEPDLQLVLDDAVKGALARFSAKAIDLKDISAQGYKAKSFSFKAGSGYISRCRFFCMKERLYQLAVTSPVSLKDTSEVDIFLKSFQFTGN